MKTLRSVLRPALAAIAAIACVSVSACANQPPRQTNMDYRSEPTTVTQGSHGTSRTPEPRLIIKSGEGERLNLPWFIQDTQNWINSN